MSDPLRTDGTHALDPQSDADRDAKIEQLLLLGLDHYFAAQHEQAINVWTRALFLDRSHPRARAYIERARSALAERLRESEEMLQNGVAAFQRGDGGEARRLIQAAIAAGAPSEEAFAVLDRLDRLAPAPPRPGRTSAGMPRPTAPRQTTSASRTAWGLVLSLAAIAALVAAGIFVVVVQEGRPLRMLAGFTPSSPSTGAPISREPTLPLPRRGEMALARAHRLTDSGHLHDALAALDDVRATDPQKAEADLLRIDIQRQLLGAQRQLLGAASGPDVQSDRHTP